MKLYAVSSQAHLRGYGPAGGDRVVQPEGALLRLDRIVRTLSRRREGHEQAGDCVNLQILTAAGYSVCLELWGRNERAINPSPPTSRISMTIVSKRLVG
jgi:hypothetical protein